jgi:hypothetical protein
MEKKDLSSEEVLSLRGLLDQNAIRDVIGQYFYSLDRRDFAALGACFTPDVHAEYFCGKAVHAGREAVVEALRAIAQFKFTNHLICNMKIKVDGDRAKADTNAIAYIIVDDGGGKGRVLVRGIEYLDDLVHGPEGWRISRRLHIPTWQYDVASVPPAIPQVT